LSVDYSSDIKWVTVDYSSDIKWLTDDYSSDIKLWSLNIQVILS
jgi:hypothetical protein